MVVELGMRYDLQSMVMRMSAVAELAKIKYRTVRDDKSMHIDQLATLYRMTDFNDHCATNARYLVHLVFKLTVSVSIYVLFSV